MTIGGLRLPELSDRSRLGEESRDEGLEDRERGEMGLGCSPRRPPGVSSETNTRHFPSEYVKRTIHSLLPQKRLFTKSCAMYKYFHAQCAEFQVQFFHYYVLNNVLFYFHD